MPEPVSIGVAGITFVAYLATRPTSAVSQEAGVLRRSAVGIMESAERSIALFGPRTSLISEILAIADECGHEDWDGEGCPAISKAVIASAIDFVRAIPSGVPLPEAAAEPDGSISLDWISSKTRVFSLSITESNRIAFAWIDGTDRGHGVARFDGDVLPPRIHFGIREITNERVASFRPA